VFSFPAPDESLAHAERAKTLGGVGVGIMDYRGSNDDRAESDTIRQAYVSGMHKFVLWLLDNGRTVRVFGGDTADDTFVRDFVADVQASRPGLDSSQLAAVSATTFRDLMQHIAAVDTVVATRFHNVLCALKLAKPTIAISYGSKHDALMHNMGQTAYCHPAKSVRADQLVRQFADLERQSAEIREMLIQRSAASTRLAESQLAELSSALFSQNGGGPVG
jgi:polysaccharide pyruvyl transferase WcaK-like protein